MFHFFVYHRYYLLLAQSVTSKEDTCNYFSAIIYFHVVLIVVSKTKTQKHAFEHAFNLPNHQ